MMNSTTPVTLASIPQYGSGGEGKRNKHLQLQYNLPAWPYFFHKEATASVNVEKKASFCSTNSYHMFYLRNWRVCQ